MDRALACACTAGTPIEIADIRNTANHWTRRGGFCIHEQAATSAAGPGALVDCCSEAVADRSGSGGQVAASATMQKRR